MIRRAALFVAGSLLASGLFSASPAAADLLIDPTGGTSLVFSDPDNSARNRPLGFTGQFFGLDKTTVDISTNGNWNFTAKHVFCGRRVSSLHRPHCAAVGRPDAEYRQRVYARNDCGENESRRLLFLHLDERLPNDELESGKDRHVSSRLVRRGGGDWNLRVQKNDIAFSYQAVNADFDGGAATVGVNLGSANAATPLPGTTNGVITSATKNLLPLTNHQFVLFRVNIVGGYDASVQTSAASGVTVTGRIALEGVPDLSRVIPDAPLGKFHVSLRSPGSLSESYGYDVTLTVTGGAFGAYTLANVPAGTYDVRIKGGKNLAVLVSNVTVTASGGAVPDVTLPAADANGDNSVDTSDFSVLVGGYNGDSAIPGSGYDPNADFNFDGSVDTSDFALLVSEYNNVGAN